MSTQRFGQTLDMGRWRQFLCALDPNSVSLLLLISATYLACFSLSHQTGLYEDDYLHARYLGWDWTSLSRLIEYAWETWPQGRPLAKTLALVLVYLSNGLGELAALKMWSFFLLSANACLTFLILRRVVPLPAAFVGGLMMVVFPGDAAKMEIIRALQLQPVMLLFLLSTWLYLKDHRIIPYLSIGLSLLIYENVALLFFLAPLLNVPLRHSIVRQTFVHCLCLTIVIMAVVLIRTQFGPGDLTELDSEIGGFNPVERSIVAMIFGFWVNLKLLALRPVTSLIEITIWGGLVMSVVSAAVYAWLRSQSDRAFGKLEPTVRPTLNPLKWSAPVQLLLVGVLLILAAYPLMVTFERFPPVLEIGRRTSSHTAASFGTSVLMAAIFWQSTRFFRSQTAHRAMSICLAIYVGLLAGFQVAVQQGLSLGWGYQKQFWQSVLAETPDLEEGDLIIVQVLDPLPETPYIKSYGYYTNLVLPMIFRFQRGPGAAPARVIWADQIDENRAYFPARIFSQNRVSLKLPFESRKRSNMDGKFIWLVARTGGLKRVSGPKVINGVDVNLKPLPKPGSEISLKRGPLYRYLME